jgi:hypothetical protein
MHLSFPIRFLHGCGPCRPPVISWPSLLGPKPRSCVVAAHCSTLTRASHLPPRPCAPRSGGWQWQPPCVVSAQAPLRPRGRAGQSCRAAASSAHPAAHPGRSPFPSPVCTAAAPTMVTSRLHKKTTTKVEDDDNYSFANDRLISAVLLF